MPISTFQDWAIVSCNVSNGRAISDSFDIFAYNGDCKDYARDSSDDDDDYSGQKDGSANYVTKIT